MTEYDRSRWIELFRMSKETFLDIVEYLRPTISRRNTNYRDAVAVEARVACAIYKLVHGCKYVQCSELFAIGKSTIGLVLREIVRAINVVYMNLVLWLVGEKMRSHMLEFRQLCGLSSIHGAIDGTHFEIKKPVQYPEDYFYYRTNAYAVHMQAVVDSRKCFIDLYIGLPASINDRRVLRKSYLYRSVTQRDLLNIQTGMIDNVLPYLIGDKGYPCLSWLLVPHKNEGRQPLNVLERLFNRRLSKGRALVKNAFANLKLMFKELSQKTTLNLQFVPDMIYACCILHNILFGEKDVHVQELL
jgi:hypothetical protein